MKKLARKLYIRMYRKELVEISNDIRRDGKNDELTFEGSEARLRALAKLDVLEKLELFI